MEASVPARPLGSWLVLLITIRKLVSWADIQESQLQRKEGKEGFEVRQLLGSISNVIQELTIAH